MRRTPLAKQSDKNIGVRNRDSKAKLVCFAIYGERCLFAGIVIHKCWGVIDPMHNYPKSTHPWLRYNPLNILPGCRALHDYFHAHPIEARERMLAMLSSEDSKTLQQLAREKR